MKKAFIIGFAVGIIYFLVNFIISGIVLHWDFSNNNDLVLGLLNIPGAIVLMLIEYLRLFEINNYQALTIMGICDGLTIGFIFILCVKIIKFHK